MKELFTAIRTRYSGDPLASALTQMYVAEADEGAVFPYAIVSVPSQTATWTFTEDGEIVLIQFDIFSSSETAEQIEGLLELLYGTPSNETGFDFAELSLPSFDQISFVRQGTIRTKQEGVWQYSITYQAEFHKKVSGDRVLPSSSKFLYNLMHI